MSMEETWCNWFELWLTLIAHFKEKKITSTKSSLTDSLWLYPVTQIRENTKSPKLQTPEILQYFLQSSRGWHFTCLYEPLASVFYTFMSVTNELGLKKPIIKHFFSNK